MNIIFLATILKSNPLAPVELLNGCLDYLLIYKTKIIAPEFQVTEIFSTLASGTANSIYFTGNFQSQFCICSLFRKQQT